MIITFLLGLILGVGLISFSLYAGKTTEPNSAMGIRTKATLANSDAWIAGHRAAKPWIFTSGITVILLAFTGQALSLTGFSEATAEYISISGVLAGVAILIVATNIANKSARNEKSGKQI